MGGYGSGKRWYYESKSTTNDYSCIDIRRWKRKELLIPNNSFNLINWKDVISLQADISPDLNYSIIKYCSKKEGSNSTNLDYFIRIFWMECHFGGKRPWFICPLKKCGKRVAILYGGPIFACRHCFNLAYCSQRETIYERAIRRMQKIKARLQWDTGVFAPEQGKPKGMHWRTFKRLCKRQQIYKEIILSQISTRFEVDYSEILE